MVIFVSRSTVRTLSKRSEERTVAKFPLFLQTTKNEPQSALLSFGNYCLFSATSAKGVYGFLGNPSNAYTALFFSLLKQPVTDGSNLVAVVERCHVFHSPSRLRKDAASLPFDEVDVAAFGNQFLCQPFLL